MGKIAPVSAKYIVHASFQSDGIVERPDVIGAVFGQTEGLLGADLELRELQKSGRIGRIEVELNTKGGRTSGKIIIPSSLDKAETAIIAASLETIQRVGPCNAAITIDKIEDVRISKREYIVERAKGILHNLIETSMPKSQEITEEVKKSVKALDIIEYGEDRLPAGSGILDSEEIIVVEGRADVINLLRNGIRNVIAINGTSIPKTIIDLCSRKVVTAFVDGDRGGDLILRELMSTAEIDFVVKAPDGKEVEELTNKEIYKLLRTKAPIEQVKAMPKKIRKRGKVSGEMKEIFLKYLEELIGTKGAYLINKNMEILGKIPLTELKSLSNDIKNIFAIVVDGAITSEIADIASKRRVAYLIGTKDMSKIKVRTTILAKEELIS